MPFPFRPWDWGCPGWGAGMQDDLRNACDHLGSSPWTNPPVSWMQNSFFLATFRLFVELYQSRHSTGLWSGKYHHMGLFAVPVSALDEGEGFAVPAPQRMGLPAGLFASYLLGWAQSFLCLKTPWQCVSNVGKLKTALWAFSPVSFGLGTLKCIEVTWQFHHNEEVFSAL